MRNRFLASISVLALVIAMVSFAAKSATGQTTAAVAKGGASSTKTWTLPKTQMASPISRVCGPTPP